jgi:hypothetical protein
MEIILPIKGVSKGLSADKQQAATSGYLDNVRPRDVLENKLRIGQRPGLDKWGAGTQIGGSEQPVVAICVVASVV